MKKREEKKNISTIIIALFIVFSMVIGIFAIVVDNGSSGIPNYNKHSFILTDTGYKTKINGEYKTFYYYPGDLENIEMDKAVSEQLKNMVGLGLVFNPYQNTTDNLVYIDVVRFELQNELDKTVYFGITNASTNYSTLPVVNCSIATAEFPLIIIDTNVNYSSEIKTFRVSDENPYCIMLNAKLRDLLAAKDRIVYTYYGIME